ncbi:Oxo-4-hydroxy-4-carboxy-5-ureidoimidazoline decarboxylase [Stemphylium lycopersici]|uniref:Oxo-4-hydroxy-4-carboxy-5-ureidoimidazoline decarboxylase n=1 Tax=Stemphylium lycopersici TaxID=183478 RepID=A0A364N6N8_STELY|nr:oxo-4-hydroxy-4-carboxy-5-ureidoimidazoline [Stemphylium lycopersici]RAR03567.1 Oxo-4-hydroxy-4-carboxy-5-ureidoimidazoline decarboxylase [Stemphylium lycopersici]RAR12912.1 Oxo-4-hydroxy-4-carboxy-5-ureidoimidazoline decarboxylase [Stemphylium lycopersici]
MTSLPPITTLPHASSEDLTHVLDLLFEPSPPLRSITLPVLRSATFPSYDILITAVTAQLSALAGSSDEKDVARLSEILCSHPRLGEKKVDSEQSRKEQAQLQQGAEEEKEKLAALNREYEDKFPGLRYVVFVNGRPRPEIMDNMRSRIDRGDAKAERLEAIQAMCDIALDRAAKLQKV